MKVTLEAMKQSAACEKSLRRFQRIFGEEQDPTIEVLDRVATFFDWDCAATKLLTKSQQERYERLVRPAHQKYRTDNNFRDYLRSAAQAWGIAYRGK